MSIISETSHPGAHSTPRERREEFARVVLAVSSVTALVVTLNALLVDSLFPMRPGDATHYVALASNPLEAVGYPFTYRPLTPALVHLLPTSIETGFIVVNLLGIVATGVAFVYYLRAIGFTERLSYFGMGLLLLSPMLVYNVVNVYLVDVLSYLFTVLALYAIVTHNDRLLAVSLVLGVLSKETALIAVPVYLLYRWRLEGRTTLRRAIPVVAPAAMTFVAIRLFYGLSSYFSLATIQGGIAAQLTKIQTSVFYLPAEVASVFGTLWLAGLLGARRTDSDFLEVAMLVLPLTFLQVLVAKDTARVLFVGFPLVIPAALVCFQSPLPRRTLAVIGGLSIGAAIVGIVGVVFVLPAMAGNLLSVSIDGLTFLAVTKILHELLIAGGVVVLCWTASASDPLR